MLLKVNWRCVPRQCLSTHEINPLFVKPTSIPDITFGLFYKVLSARVLCCVARACDQSRSCSCCTCCSESVHVVISKAELVHGVAGSVIVLDSLFLSLFLLSRMPDYPHMQQNDPRWLRCDWFTRRAFTSEPSFCFFLQAVETNLASKDSHWVYATEVRPGTSAQIHLSISIFVAMSFQVPFASRLHSFLVPVSG